MVEEHRARERPEEATPEEGIHHLVGWAAVEEPPQATFDVETGSCGAENCAGIGAAREEVVGDRQAGAAAELEGGVDAACRERRDMSRRVPYEQHSRSG